MSNPREQQNEWAKVVAKAWADESFKQRLLTDSQAVLKEHGLDAPAGIELKVVEDTATARHLVLPAKPVSGEVTDELLDQVAAGSYSWAVHGDKTQSGNPIR